MYLKIPKQMKNKTLSSPIVALAVLLTTCIGCMKGVEDSSSPSPEPIIGCFVPPSSLKTFTPTLPPVSWLLSGSVEVPVATKSLSQVVSSGVLTKDLQGLSDSLSMYLTMNPQTLAEKIKLIPKNGNTPADVKVQLDKLTNHPTIIKYLTTLTLPWLDGELVKSARVGTVTEVAKINASISECKVLMDEALNTGKKQLEHVHLANLNIANEANQAVVQMINGNGGVCEAAVTPRMATMINLVQNDYVNFLTPTNISNQKPENTNFLLIVSYVLVSDASEKLEVLRKAEQNACALQTTKMIDAAKATHELNLTTVENLYTTGLNDLIENYNKAVLGCNSQSGRKE
jgi:hypothetical protein